MKKKKKLGGGGGGWGCGGPKVDGRKVPKWELLFSLNFSLSLFTLTYSHTIRGKNQNKNKVGLKREKDKPDGLT